MKKQTQNCGLACRKAYGAFLVCICLFLNVGVVLAQNSLISITGVVKDPLGEPVIGATVLEKGNQSNGTITDLDGNFALKVVSDATIEVSYIGYTTESIPVNGRTFLNVILKEDSRQLDEVVVVGFGVQKKVNLTGSVGIATAKDIESRPVQNAVQALQGVIPGLNITTKDQGGELNGSRKIQIRGTGTVGDDSKSDPLILIDGMEGDINTINPQDIESISVLKDAAASSIYGSRAPFGVILITTKSGKEGRTSVNYNANFRYNTPVKMQKMQNSWEFVNYFDDAMFNQGNGGHFGSADVPDFMDRVYNYYMGNMDPNDVMVPWTSHAQDFWNYDYPNANVDWLKEYYKTWSPSQEHNLSASGGNSKINFYMSANYMTQDGFIRHGTDNYDRYTITGKISAQLNEYVKVDYSSRFIRTDYERPTYWNDGFYNDVLRRARPIRPVYDPNGYLANDINYVGVMRDGGRHREQNDSQYQQVRVTITPLKDWNIIGEMNMKTGTDWTHWEQYRVYSHLVSGEQHTSQSNNTSAGADKVSEYAYKYTLLNPNVYTNYSKSFGKHNLAGTFGFQAEQFNERKLEANRADITLADLPVLNLTSSDSDYKIAGEYQKWATAGFFGRINYDYEGRYLVEGNLRYDGSSRYRAGNRWVWSPSFSLGWNLAQENFWESLSDYVGMFKIRGSYGALANQNTKSYYPTYQILEIKGNNSNWITGSGRENTAWAPKIVSASLTWEKIKSANIGVDFGAFNNRFTGSFDWFNRKTENMVGAGIELPSILGTDVPKTNNTDLKTYGWELQLGWRDRVGQVDYGVRFNISDAQTKILRYANPTGTLSKDYREGEVIGNIYGYITKGIAKTQEEMDAHLAKVDQSSLGSNWGAGDIMYEDLDGNGRITKGDDTIYDMGDRKKLGNTTPRFFTGINLDIAWKGFDLQMFWQGVLKRDWAPKDNSMIYWGATSSGEFWSTAFKEHLDYFRDENSSSVIRGGMDVNLDSHYPKAMFGNKNTQVQSRYIENAAYMRLKNLQLGYTFPKSWTQKLLIQNLRVFVSGENLLTITKLRGVIDPESVGIGKQDGTTYPLSKTYSFGLSVNF